MKAHASEHMNSTSSPISSGSPNRFIGTSSRKRCTSSGDVCAALWNGVRTGPGEIERQRIPACPNSRPPPSRSRPQAALARDITPETPGPAARVPNPRRFADPAVPVPQHVRQNGLQGIERPLHVEQKRVVEERIVNVEKLRAAQRPTRRV